MIARYSTIVIRWAMFAAFVGANQHRLVQVRGERSRSLLRRHRAARRSLPTLGPALLLQDRAHTLSLLHLVLAIIVGTLRLGVIVLERIQTSSGDLRARWGLRGEKSAWIGGRAASGRGVRRVVGSHLSSRVLVHALERLGDCLDAGRLSLYHLESLARLGFRLKGGIGDLRTGRSGVYEPGLRPNIGVRDPRARPAASDSIGESPGMAKGMDRRRGTMLLSKFFRFVATF